MGSSSFYAICSDTDSHAIDWQLRNPSAHS